MLTSRCVYDLCFASYVTLYSFPGCITFRSVILIQLLVQFTCMCMFNTNHCHKTPISWIPIAQTIGGDVMYQSSDNHLVVLRSGRVGRTRGLNIKTSKLDVKHFQSLDKLFIYSGRWLETFIPEKCTPLLNFDELTIGRCKLLLYLVLYL